MPPQSIESIREFAESQCLRRLLACEFVLVPLTILGLVYWDHSDPFTWCSVCLGLLWLCQILLVVYYKLFPRAQHRSPYELDPSVGRYVWNYVKDKVRAAVARKKAKSGKDC